MNQLVAIRTNHSVKIYHTVLHKMIQEKKEKNSGTSHWNTTVLYVI